MPKFEGTSAFSSNLFWVQMFDNITSQLKYSCWSSCNCVINQTRMPNLRYLITSEDKIANYTAFSIPCSLFYQNPIFVTFKNSPDERFVFTLPFLFVLCFPF